MERGLQAGIIDVSCLKPRTEQTDQRTREIAEKFSKRCRNLTRFCRRSKRRRKRAGDNRRDGVLSARWHEDNGIRRAVPIDRIDARAVVDLYLGQRDYFLQRWGEEDANSVQFEQIPIIRHVCTNTILERKLYAIIVLRGKIKKDTPSIENAARRREEMKLQTNMTISLDKQDFGGAKEVYGSSEPRIGASLEIWNHCRGNR